jgi:RNase P subunit RPR2
LAGPHCAETLRQLASTRGACDGCTPPRIRAVSAEQVALIPQCAECGEVWLPADEDRWRAYLDTDSELVFYCPQCAEREFDN